MTATVTQRRRLGTSGPVVSAIGLGFMSFVISTSADEAKLATDLVDRAIDLGITFFDTADVYGPEHSEILLGRAIRGCAATAGARTVPPQVRGNHAA